MPGLLTLLSLVSGLAVDGNNICHRPAEVADRLRAILPEEFAEPEHQLHLSTEDGALVLTLTTRDGEVLASRRLLFEGSCPRLARQAAVIAAAWQGDLADEPLPLPPAAQEDEIQLTERPPSPPAAPRIAHSGYVGLALRSLVGPGIFGFGVELEAGKNWGRLGLAGSLSGPLPWARLGPTYTIITGTPTVDLRAQGEFALVFRSPDSVVPAAGVELGTRVWPSRTGTRYFIDLGAGYLFNTAAYLAMTAGFAFGGSD